MTREEILGIPSYPHECGSMIEVHTRQDALKAMSEFAQQEAIEFVEWVNTDFKAMVKSASDRQDKTEFARLVKLTTTELYSLFKTTQNG